MLGLLCWNEERAIRLERAQMLGLSVLRVSFAPGGRWEKQRLSRVARMLAGQGVRRVLVPPGFDRWQMLNRRGLTGVDPLPLYRAMADRLVLAELERRGVEAHKACVALRGECVDGDLVRAAYLLCPRVRTLLIQVEWGGEKLTRDLYREFGAGEPSCTRADVAVRFSGKGQGGELVLCGKPELPGLELEVPGLTVPEGAELLPLLTALWQAGVLHTKQLRVSANKCS